MGNLDGFNAHEVEPQKAYDPIPAGEYTAAIVGSKFVPTKDATGSFLELTLRVLEGDYTGRKLFDRLNLDNPNAKAVQIARAQLSAVCRATGVMQPGDSAALHDIPIRIVVRQVKRRDNGDISNEIRGYKPMAAQAAAAASATASPTPNGPAGARPPWKRSAGAQ